MMEDLSIEKLTGHKGTAFDAVRDASLYGFRGSIAHGLYIPPEDDMGTDDVDFMGVVIAPLDCYFGLKRFDQIEIQRDHDDIIVYEIRKFFRLLLKGNPNLLSFIWNDPRMFTKVDPVGQLILDNRDLFTSKKAFNAFKGYAKAQFAKMTKADYQGYMGTKRKAIVDKFGFDTKHASHLIRLLTMGIEFLQTGILKVYRDEDREYLIDIKQGRVRRGSVEHKADQLFRELDIALTESKLPEKPNAVLAEQFLMDILSFAYARQNLVRSKCHDAPPEYAIDGSDGKRFVLKNHCSECGAPFEITEELGNRLRKGY